MAIPACAASKRPTFLIKTFWPKADLSAYPAGMVGAAAAAAAAGAAACRAEWVMYRLMMRHSLGVHVSSSRTRRMNISISRSIAPIPGVAAKGLINSRICCASSGVTVWRSGWASTSGSLRSSASTEDAEAAPAPAAAAALLLAGAANLERSSEPSAGLAERRMPELEADTLDAPPPPPAGPLCRAWAWALASSMACCRFIPLPMQQEIMARTAAAPNTVTAKMASSKPKTA